MDQQEQDRKKIVYEDRNYTSEQISSLSRYIGFGLIATTFLILAGKYQPFSIILENYKVLLGLTTLCGILTILSDYLQYVMGSISSRKASNRQEEPFLVNKKAIHYRLRSLFFKLKQVFSIGGSILLILIFILAFFTK